MSQRMKEALKQYIKQQGPKQFAKIARDMVGIVQDVMSDLGTKLHTMIDPVISKIPKEF